MKRQWLLSYKNASGLTYKEIAKYLGVSIQTVSYWISGGRIPKPAMAKKIAKLLRFDWTKFYE